MKAMVLNKPGPVEESPLELMEVDEPLPAPEEIRLQVSACGICHTDLHIVEGEIPTRKLPLIPGHQVVGLVDKVGEGVRRFKPGDRVGITWLSWTCGKCEFCLGGKENLCPQARFTGYDCHGGYAQFALAHQAFAYPIPPPFSDQEVAPLLCAGIIGFRALRLSGVQKGERLGLFGFGASAHLVLQVAASWGCPVFVFTRSQGHRALARELGAAWVGGVDEEPPQPLHAAIVFAPAGEVVPPALLRLEKGGTLVLGGIYLTPIPPLDYRRHLYQEKTIKSVTNLTRQDAEDFLTLAGQIPLRPHLQAFPLEEANSALLLLKQGKIQGAGVLKIGD